MYNLIRLLLPKFDSERQTYGLKEGVIPKVDFCKIVDSKANIAWELQRFIAALAIKKVIPECVFLDEKKMTLVALG